MPAPLLTLLRCPHTNQRLLPVTSEEIAQFEQLRASNQLRYQNGASIALPLESVLINESRTLLYIVESGIPILLPDEAVPLS
ncbi:MAG: hypothetical protein QM796_05600 [Chthoniobacteraceae bacterium]